MKMKKKTNNKKEDNWMAEPLDKEGNAIVGIFQNHLNKVKTNGDLDEFIKRVVFAETLNTFKLLAEDVYGNK